VRGTRLPLQPTRKILLCGGRAGKCPKRNISSGASYYNGVGVLQDNELAAAWYRKAANQGNADAKETLAIFTSEVKEFLRTTCRRRLGFVKRPIRATRMRKETLARVIQKAKEYHRTTSRRWPGIAKRLIRATRIAQYILGELYHTGKGVPQDNEQAAGLVS